MKIVAIICEYNPLHTGHEHQISCIRRAFGADTAIIAIMSGNYTQRAELAVADKFTRARWAVLCGADLVLELPFPYSMSSAEYFALGGVGIADALGIVDVLSFGSECGDIETLRRVAYNLQGDAHRRELSRILASDKRTGHARASLLAYEALYGAEDLDILRSPNNILALEYIKALDRLGSRIAPHTVKREGADYTEIDLNRESHPSAMAIRNALRRGDTTAILRLPECIQPLVKEAISEGKMSSDAERISSAILSFFLLNNSDVSDTIHDASDGLYHRLAAKSREATSLASFIALSETKKYTRARIRRAIFASLFGVTSSDLGERPGYTQLLASGARGLQLLKRIKDASHLPILTKPSSYEQLDARALRAKELSDRADALFALSLPKREAMSSAMRKTPYIEK